MFYFIFSHILKSGHTEEVEGKVKGKIKKNRKKERKEKREGKENLAFSLFLFVLFRVTHLLLQRGKKREERKKQKKRKTFLFLFFRSFGVLCFLDSAPSIFKEEIKQEAQVYF